MSNRITTGQMYSEWQSMNQKLNELKTITQGNKVVFPDTQKVQITNPMNLPTDYPDSAVKAELELIKAQQKQILDRLDGEFRTQVTGSLVEESLFTNTTIKAGSYVIKFVDLLDCNRYTIGARNDGTGKFSIRTRLQSAGREWYSGQTTLASGDLFALTDLQTVTTGRLAIFIYNDGTEDVIIRESSINKIS